MADDWRQNNPDTLSDPDSNADRDGESPKNVVALPSKVDAEGRADTHDKTNEQSPERAKRAMAGYLKQKILKFYPDLKVFCINTGYSLSKIYRITSGRQRIDNQLANILSDNIGDSIGYWLTLEDNIHTIAPDLYKNIYLEAPETPTGEEQPEIETIVAEEAPEEEPPPKLLTEPITVSFNDASFTLPKGMDFRQAKEILMALKDGSTLG